MSRGSRIRRILDWAYDHAIDGLAGISSAAEMAEKHLKAADGDPERAIDTLIAAHTAYAGLAGFATNIGGAMTLPVSVPVNLASVLALQLRLVAAIAHLRRYKTDDRRVKTMAFLCMTGTGAATVLQGVGIRAGKKLSAHAIGHISGALLPKINHAVGLRLAAAAGGTGLGKAVPLVGGVIGGVCDAAVTRGIGAAAKSIFVPMGEAAAAG
jgi:hypothetical protein